ncbi:MAG: hypothetical protein ACK5TU_15625 [Cyclobacteriaceae bacterium]|jgi:hypothetical protein
MNATTKFLILAFWLFSQLSSTFAQTKEVDAIKAVISKETSSYFNVDYKGWADTWLKVPYAYWSYSDSTNTSFVESWDALEKSKVSYFKNSKPSRAVITNEWQEVRVYGNGAYVRFIQRVKDDIDRDETSQMRVLEKTKEGWKVICVAAIARYPKE